MSFSFPAFLCGQVFAPASEPAATFIRASPAI
jgi:hypothetical protein